MNDKARKWLAVFAVLVVCYLLDVPVWMTIIGAIAASKV